MDKNDEKTPAVKDKDVPEKCECITIRPATDVTDEYDGMEITFELPGVSAQNVELEVKDRLLTLKAKSSMHRRNLPIVYKRAFYLSDAVDAENISARISDGILTLFLPKSECAKTHKITVE